MTNSPDDLDNKEFTLSYSPAEQKDPPSEKRTFTMLQVSGTINKITRQAFRKKNFVLSQIATDWITIIGEHYGKISRPHQLYQETLTIACSSTTAAELYYVTNIIMEKVNRYCGKKIITKIKFTYKKIIPPSFPSEENRSSSTVQPVIITDLPKGPLQEALARLGGRIKAKTEKQEEKC